MDWIGDLICLGNLSFGTFRAPELRYQGGVRTDPLHMGQYLKKPTYDRVKLCTHSKIHLDPIFLDTFTFLGQKCNFLFIYSSKTEYLHWKQICLLTLVDKMVYIIKLCILLLVLYCFYCNDQALIKEVTSC